MCGKGSAIRRFRDAITPVIQGFLVVCAVLDALMFLLQCVDYSSGLHIAGIFMVGGVYREECGSEAGSGFPQHRWKLEARKSGTSLPVGVHSNGCEA